MALLAQCPVLFHDRQHLEHLEMVCTWQNSQNGVAKWRYLFLPQELNTYNALSDDRTRNIQLGEPGTLSWFKLSFWLPRLSPHWCSFTSILEIWCYFKRMQNLVFMMHLYKTRILETASQALNVLTTIWPEDLGSSFFRLYEQHIIVKCVRLYLVPKLCW